MSKQLRNVYRCLDSNHLVLEMSIFGFDFMERVFMCTNCNIYFVYGPGSKNMVFKFKKKCSDMDFMELGSYLTPLNGREERLGLFHMPIPI